MHDADAFHEDTIARAFLESLMRDVSRPSDKEETEYIIQELVPCLVPG